MKYLAGLFVVVLVTSILFIPNSTGEEIGNIIIVDKNGNGDYNSITSAIFNANDGDIIRVYSGIYEENIILFKSIDIIGNGTGETKIYGKNLYSVIHISANNCRVSDLHVSKGGPGTDNVGNAGIYIDSDNNIISNCNSSDNRNIGLIIGNGRSGNKILNCSFTNNSKGMMLYLCSGNEISNNHCVNNKGPGIELLESNENQISNNKCHFNSWGLYVEGKDNKISRNDFRNNDETDMVIWGDNYLENNQGSINDDSDPGVSNLDKSMILPALIILGVIFLGVIIVIKKILERRNEPPSSQ